MHQVSSITIKRDSFFDSRCAMTKHGTGPIKRAEKSFTYHHQVGSERWELSLGNKNLDGNHKSPQIVYSLPIGFPSVAWQKPVMWFSFKISEPVRQDLEISVCNFFNFFKRSHEEIITSFTQQAISFPNKLSPLSSNHDRPGYIILTGAISSIFHLLFHLIWYQSIV